MISLDEVLSTQGIDEIEQNYMDNTQDVVSNNENFSGTNEPFFKTKMLNTIQEVDNYSWRRGEMGGMDWGFENLNKAFEGLNAGVHLIGGASNIGN